MEAQPVVTIRRGAAADAAALAEIAALTFPLACPPHVSDEAKAAFIAQHLSETAFAGYLVDAARDILLAETSAAGDAIVVVGYAMLVAGEPTDADVARAVGIRPTVELSKCYVHPGHHGAGVAASLMAAALETARERGAAGVWLGVNQQNARAQSFYVKHGFARVGTKRFLVGERYEDDFVYERAL